MRYMPAVICLFLLAGCVSGNATFRTDSTREAQEVTAHLRLPDGAGPHPAVILLHGCGGLERDRPGQFVWRGLNLHADALIDAGFATLIVDSWGSRGLTFDELMRTHCRTGGGVSSRVDDLYGAIAHLNSLPEIDGSRIGAVGLSEGGQAVLRALQVSEYRKRDHRLAAVVGFYPSCYVTAPFYAPSLILIGDADDITPSSQCASVVYTAELVERGRSHLWDDDAMPRYVPDLVIYPGVHHSFDLPFSGVHRIPIGTVAASVEATRDARDRMIGFFRTYLLP